MAISWCTPFGHGPINGLSGALEENVVIAFWKRATGERLCKVSAIRQLLPD